MSTKEIGGGVPSNATPAGRPEFDVGLASDTSPWTPYQKLVLLLCSLVIVLDGFDALALGFAAPALLPDLNLTKEDLAPVLAIGLIGMTIGATIGGILGDKFGRKIALLASTIIFGSMTGAIAFANDLPTLGLFRFIAGIGLGGALPNVTALVAEYTPQHRRSFAVTLSLVCMAVGGVVGGFVSAEALPALGWRGLFAVAGALPLVLAVARFLLLPESPRFLVTRPERSNELRQIFERMRFDVPSDAVFVDRSESGVNKPSAATLLRPPYLCDTLLLWLAFFGCLLAVFMSFNWLPTMLADAGFDLPTSSRGLLTFNVGAIVAAVLVSWIILFTGSRLPMLIMALGGAGGALALSRIGFDPAAPKLLLLTALALLGGCIVGLQVVLYVLASHVYPTLLRATGVGLSAGIGRVGAVLSSFIGAAALSGFGPVGFYYVVAAAMAVTAIALLLVRRHIPPSAKTGTTPAAGS